MHLGRPKCVYFLAILSIFAIVHGFVIEDTCETNGQICQSD